MGDNSNLPRGRGPVRSSKSSQVPWEPSIRDLEIYAGLAEGRSTRSLGEQFGLAASRIHAIGRKIDAWLRPQWMEHIREVKVRQTESLMVIFRESMDAWRRSKLDAVSSTDKTTSTGGEQSITRKGQVGNPQFLSEARAALADIRKIWGADAAEPSEDTEFRVAGRPLEEAIRDHIGHLQAVIEPRDN